LPQTIGADARHTDVNCFGLHMQAVSRYATTVGSEEFVAPRGTVTTNDVDFATGMSDGGGQVNEEVVESGIEMANCARTLVAQKIVDLFESVLEIGVRAAIYDIQPFVGMRVITARDGTPRTVREQRSSVLTTRGQRRERRWMPQEMRPFASLLQVCDSCLAEFREQQRR
jgi:hypothetical protein